MKKSEVWSSLVAALIALFFSPLIGTVFGWVGGWIVGLLFDSAILGALEQFGVADVTVAQLGALLGFAGGFLTTKVRQ